MDTFLSAFALLFVVLDPLGVATVFAALTAQESARRRRSIALRTVAVAGAVLLFFVVAGNALFSAIGVTTAALTLAGGVILFIVGLEMIFEMRSARRERLVRDQESGDPFADVAIVPLALPLLAGPASITTVVLLTSAPNDGLTGAAIAAGAVAANLAITLVLLLAAATLVSRLGAAFNLVVTRVLGTVLCALAAENILRGVAGILGPGSP